MKYYTTKDKKEIKKAREQLNFLDMAILEKCDVPYGMNILRVLKAGKPYYRGGSRVFATTNSILNSVEKLLKLELLSRR